MKYVIVTTSTTGKTTEKIINQKAVIVTAGKPTSMVSQLCTTQKASYYFQ